jgi:hypothetical protein
MAAQLAASQEGLSSVRKSYLGLRKGHLQTDALKEVDELFHKVVFLKLSHGG